MKQSDGSAFSEAFDDLVNKVCGYDTVDELVTISREYQSMMMALDRMCELVGYEYNYCCHHSEEDGKCKGDNCRECWRRWCFDEIKKG